MKESMVARLLAGDVTLEQALFSNAIDPRALHTFACDCAARAILCEEQQYREVPRPLQKAIATKRDWIDGLCDDKTMQKTRDFALSRANENKRENAMTYSPWAIRRWSGGYGCQSMAHTLQAAMWAISLDGEDAAENASKEACEAVVYARGTTRAQERAWQRRRLAFLHDLATVTHRMWLALEPDYPLPIDKPKRIELSDFDA